MGHADLATTAIYQHPDGRRTAQAIAARGEALDGNKMETAAEKAR